MRYETAITAMTVAVTITADLTFDSMFGSMEKRHMPHGSNDAQTFPVRKI